MMICSLQSSNSEQDEEDEQRNLVNNELERSGKTRTSQLVQEEKAETGSVCSKFQCAKFSMTKAIDVAIFSWWSTPDTNYCHCLSRH